MTDDTPYIIVDNRKIAPIERLSRPDVAAADPAGRERRTFGVVDRVTISKEARDKARHLQARAEADPPSLDDLTKNPPTNNSPLLTYSPKQRQ